MSVMENGRLKSVISPAGIEYRIQNTLGAGGFGITYKAVSSTKGRRREWALKEYFPDALAVRNPDTGEVVPNQGKRPAYYHGKRRFLEEAELLKQLNIPGIVRVYDFFEANGTAYYVMELIKGATLRQVLRANDGKLPFASVLNWIVRCAQALDQLHIQAGVFHRDISPENIMLLEDGAIRIIDFGSAKFMDISEKQNYSIVLKPGFAPPEQYASNVSQGSFTDVYALAGTFYYLATGRMVPPAPDRLSGAVYTPLCDVVEECTADISRAVDNALNMDARFRTQTMGEFIREMNLSPGRKRGEHRKAQPAEKPLQATVPDMQGGGGGGAYLPVKTIRDEDQPDPEKGNDMKAYSVGAQCAYIQPIRNGKPSSGVIPLASGVSFHVGRSAKKSQIALFQDAMEVSQQHVSIAYSQEKNLFYIIDESMNGTFYKGKRLQKGVKYSVNPGAELGLGNMRNLIRLGTVNQHA